MFAEVAQLVAVKDVVVDGQDAHVIQHEKEEVLGAFSEARTGMSQSQCIEVAERVAGGRRSGEIVGELKEGVKGLRGQVAGLVVEIAALRA